MCCDFGMQITKFLETDNFTVFVYFDIFIQKVGFYFLFPGREIVLLI
jgi:hypothetical protein